MRAFGLLSGFWREQGTVSISSGTAFYNLFSGYQNGAAVTSLAPSITDRDIIQQMQYMLLESAASQATWAGTDQFVYNDFVNAMQRRLNQFLADTGIIITRSVVSGPADSSGQIALTDTVIDVRRAAWITSLGYHKPLWREDERMLTAASQSWNTAAAQAPDSYSIMAPAPLQVQFAPVPSASTGTVELLTVNTGATLNPASSATILGIPDPLCAAIKWGALADLLGKDGPARDVPRGTACEALYGLYVRAARMLPVVIQAQISGAPMIPVTITELDGSNPSWEDQAGTSTDIALAGVNLFACSPVPNAAATLTFDVVKPAPVPASDGTNIQIGREQIEMMLDYAEWLALFKVAGAEWHATEQKAKNFMQQALTYNQRISASVRSAIPAGDQSQREKTERERRDEGGKRGLGAMVS